MASNDSARRRKERLVLAVLVSAVVVLGAFAAFFYFQSMDYKGAKYRSQLQISIDISNTLMDLGIKLASVLDNSSAVSKMAVTLSSLDAERIFRSCNEIAVMYPSHETPHKAFDELGHAFDTLSIFVVQSEDIAYEEAFASIHVILSQIGNLSTNFNKAIGAVDSFSNYPDSTVDHLDLTQIREAASAILSET